MTLPIRLLALALLMAAPALGCGSDTGDGGDGPTEGGGSNSSDGGADDFGNAMRRDGGGLPLRDAATSPPSGGDAAPGSCGSTPFGATRLRANVLLAIDKSGSMAETPSGFGSDKWAALTTAMGTALDAVKSDLALGLELFPFPDECSMPSGSDMNVLVRDGESSVPDILELIEGTTPSGGTPTAHALGRALSYFQDGDGAALEGEKYVLLATDGGPACNTTLTCDASECIANLEGRCPEGLGNCCDEAVGGPGANRNCLDTADTLSQIQALRDEGVRTLVVGIPGSELFSTQLDAFAEAGGAPNTDGSTRYFAVDAAGGIEGLTETLAQVTTALVTSCRLQLDSQPPDLDRLNVDVEGTTIPRGAEDGWDLDTSTDPATVEINGLTCSRIESSGVESVTVTYGCPTLRLE